MAHSSPWAEPLKAFLNAAPAFLSGRSSQHVQYQRTYSIVPDLQQPLHDPQLSAYSPPAHYNQPTSYSPCSHESKPCQASSPLRKSFDKFGRYTKILTIFSTLISSLLSLVMEGAMVYMTYTFHHTKDRAPNYGDRSGLWAKHTKTWPTYLLLGASGVTCLFSLGILIATCCRSRKKIVFSVLYNIVHVLLWVGVTVFYRVGKTGDDLWGWSCSAKADAIQDLFQGVVHFEGLCKLQTSSWQTSIAETGIKVACSGVGWYLSKRQSKVRSKIVEEIGNTAWDQIDFDF